MMDNDGIEIGPLMVDIQFAGGGVTSVNGKTGAVLLNAEDVGAATEQYVDDEIEAARITVDSELSDSSENPVQNQAITNALAAKADTSDVVALVSQETQAREAADQSLQTDIANETRARETSAQALQSNIDSEASARISADNTINSSLATAQSNINTLQTDVENINATIPAQASAANQLADKQYVNTALAAETSNREAADTNLQSQIDAITASSDVTDIVGTYAALQAYDTSALGDKDIIKVLQDESRNDETTYYRWSTTTQSFTLIGEEGPYYTKSEADNAFVPQTRTVNNKPLSQNISLDASDIGAVSTSDIVQTTGTATDKIMSQDAVTTELAGKQDTLIAGSNITIGADGKTISAQDTTYQPFTGTDGTTAGTSGLVPAPATTDTDKFLKSDGTWASGGGQVVFVSTTASNPLRVYEYPAGTTFVATSQNTQYVRFTNTSSSTYDRQWSGFMYWNGTYCYMLNSRGLWTYFNSGYQGMDFNGVSQFGALPVRVLDQSATANRIMLTHTAAGYSPQMDVSGSYSKEPLCAYYTSNYLSRNSQVKITNDTTYRLQDTGELLVVSTIGNASDSDTSSTSYVNTIVFYTDKTTGEPVMTIIKHLNNGTEISKTEFATKDYVDTQVGNIETILQTLNSGTGAN